MPTAEFKKGDFSQLLDPAYTGDPRSGTQVGTDALGRPIVFGQIYDPSTTRTVGGSTVRDPFVGNIIPQSKWDPVATNVVQKIGIQDPTLPSLLRNIPTINGQPVFHLQTWGVKIDHQLTSKNQLSGYYNHSYRSRYNNGAGRFLPFPGPASSSWQQQITPGTPGKALPYFHGHAPDHQSRGSRVQPVLEPEWGLSDHDQRKPCLDDRTAKSAGHDVPRNPVQRAWIRAAREQHRPNGRRLRRYEPEWQLDFPG